MRTRASRGIFERDRDVKIPRDALVRITGDLHVAIALERTVRDLDHERDIARGRHPLTVESARSPQQGDVRLRFPAWIEQNRVRSEEHTSTPVTATSRMPSSA